MDESLMKYSVLVEDDINVLWGLKDVFQIYVWYQWRMISGRWRMNLMDARNRRDEVSCSIKEIVDWVRGWKLWLSKGVLGVQWLWNYCHKHDSLVLIRRREGMARYRERLYSITTCTHSCHAMSIFRKTVCFKKVHILYSHLHNNIFVKEKIILVSCSGCVPFCFMCKIVCYVCCLVLTLLC